MSGRRYGEIQRVDQQDLWRKQRPPEPPPLFPGPGRGCMPPCLKDPPSSYIGKRSLVPGDKALTEGPSFEYPSAMAPPQKDKADTYPPIVTIDGRVDTDLDKYVADIYEDDYAGPVDDVPGRFPKPHVFSVIDGSLDDDIDNYVNHDGTMEHTLVETPKKCNPSDLKDVASNDVKSRKSIEQSNRSYNKIDMELPHEQMSENRDGDSIKKNLENGLKADNPTDEAKDKAEDGKPADSSSGEGGNESEMSRSNTVKGGGEDIPVDESTQRLVTKPEFAHVKSVKEFFGLESESEPNKGSHLMNLNKSDAVSSSGNPANSSSFDAKNNFEDHGKKTFTETLSTASGTDLLRSQTFKELRRESDSQVYERKSDSDGQPVTLSLRAGSDSEVVLENKVYDPKRCIKQEGAQLKNFLPQGTKYTTYNSRPCSGQAEDVENPDKAVVVPLDAKSDVKDKDLQIAREASPPADRNFDKEKSQSTPEKVENVVEQQLAYSGKTPPKDQTESKILTSPNFLKSQNKQSDRQFSPTHKFGSRSPVFSGQDRREEFFENFSSPGCHSTRCSTSVGILDQYSKTSTGCMSYDSEEYHSDFLRTELANMSLEREPVYEKYTFKGGDKITGKKGSACMDDNQISPNIVRFKANWKPIEKRQGFGLHTKTQQKEKKREITSPFSSPESRQVITEKKHSSSTKYRPQAKKTFKENKILKNSNIEWDLACKQLYAKAEEFQKIYSRRSRHRSPNVAETDRKYKDIREKHQTVRNSPGRTRKSPDKHSIMKADKSSPRDFPYPCTSVPSKDWNILSNALQDIAYGKRQAVTGGNEKDRHSKVAKEYCTCDERYCTCDKNNPKACRSCTFKKKSCPHHACNKTGKKNLHKECKLTRPLSDRDNKYCTCAVKSSSSASFTSSDMCLDIGEHEVTSGVNIRERKRYREAYKRAASVPKKLKVALGSKPRFLQDRVTDSSKLQSSIDAQYLNQNPSNKTIKDTLRAAMKVAGESVAAAARVAEALSMVVKASKLSPPYFQRSPGERNTHFAASAIAGHTDTASSMRSKHTHSTSPDKTKSKPHFERMHYPTLRNHDSHRNNKESPHASDLLQGSGEKKARAKLVATTQSEQARHYHSSNDAGLAQGFAEKSPEPTIKGNHFSYRTKTEKLKSLKRASSSPDTGINSKLPVTQHKHRACPTEDNVAPKSPKVTIQIAYPRSPDSSARCDKRSRSDWAKEGTHKTEDTSSCSRPQAQKVSEKEANPPVPPINDDKKQINADSKNGAERQKSEQTHKAADHSIGTEKKRQGHDKSNKRKSSQNEENEHFKTNVNKPKSNKIEPLGDIKEEKKDQTSDNVEPLREAAEAQKYASTVDDRHQNPKRGTEKHKCKMAGLESEIQKQNFGLVDPRDDSQSRTKGRRSDTMESYEKPNKEAETKQLYATCAKITVQFTDDCAVTTTKASSECKKQNISIETKSQASPKRDKEDRKSSASHTKSQDHEPKTNAPPANEIDDPKPCKNSSGYESFSNRPFFNKICAQWHGSCVDPAPGADDGYINSTEENSNFNKSLQENWIDSTDLYSLEQEQQGFKHDWGTRMDEVYDSLLRFNTEPVATTPVAQKRLYERYIKTPPRLTLTVFNNKDEHTCSDEAKFKSEFRHGAQRSAPSFKKDRYFQIPECSRVCSSNKNVVKITEDDYQEGQKCPWTKEHQATSGYLYSNEYLNRAESRHSFKNQQMAKPCKKKHLPREESQTSPDAQADIYTAILDYISKKYPFTQEYTTLSDISHETFYQGCKETFSLEHQASDDSQYQHPENNNTSIDIKNYDLRQKSRPQDFSRTKEYSKDKGNLGYGEYFLKDTHQNMEATQSHDCFHSNTNQDPPDPFSTKISYSYNKKSFSQKSPCLFDHEHLHSNGYDYKIEKTDPQKHSKRSQGYPRSLKYSDCEGYSYGKECSHVQEYSCMKTKDNPHNKKFLPSQKYPSTIEHPDIKTEDCPQCKEYLNSHECSRMQRYLHCMEQPNVKNSDDPHFKRYANKQVCSSNEDHPGFKTSNSSQNHKNPHSLKYTGWHDYRRSAQERHNQKTTFGNDCEQIIDDRQDQMAPNSREYVFTRGHPHSQKYSPCNEYKLSEDQSQCHGNLQFQYQREEQRKGQVPNVGVSSHRELENAAGKSSFTSELEAPKGQTLSFGNSLGGCNYYLGQNVLEASSASSPSSEDFHQVSERQTPGTEIDHHGYGDTDRELKTHCLYATDEQMHHKTPWSPNQQEGSLQPKRARLGNSWYEQGPYSSQCFDEIATNLRPSQIYEARLRAVDDTRQEEAIEQSSSNSSQSSENISGTSSGNRDISPVNANAKNVHMKNNTIINRSVDNEAWMNKAEKEHVSHKSMSISYNKNQNVNTNNGNVCEEVEFNSVNFENKYDNVKFTNRNNESINYAFQNRNSSNYRSCRNIKRKKLCNGAKYFNKHNTDVFNDKRLIQTHSERCFYDVRNNSFNYENFNVYYNRSNNGNVDDETVDVSYDVSNNGNGDNETREISYDVSNNVNVDDEITNVNYDASNNGNIANKGSRSHNNTDPQPSINRGSTDLDNRIAAGCREKANEKELTNDRSSEKSKDTANSADTEINVLEGFDQIGTQKDIEAPRMRHHNDIIVVRKAATVDSVSKRKGWKKNEIQETKRKSCKRTEVKEDEDFVCVIDRSVSSRGYEDSNVSHVLYENDDEKSQGSDDGKALSDATSAKIDDIDGGVEYSRDSEIVSDVTGSKTETSRPEQESDVTEPQKKVDEIPFEPPAFLVERMRRTQLGSGKLQPERFGEIFRDFKLPPVVKLHPLKSKIGSGGFSLADDWKRHKIDTSLVDRLAKIKRGKGNLDLGQGYANIPQISTRTFARLWEQEIIARANESIFKRLLHQESVYSREDQLRDYERKLPILAGMSRYPQNVRKRTMSPESRRLKAIKANMLVKEQARAIDEYYGCTDGSCRNRFARNYSPPRVIGQRLLAEPNYDYVQSHYSRDEMMKDYQRLYKEANPERRLSPGVVKRVTFKPEAVGKAEQSVSSGYSAEKPQRRPK